jgi:predicted deacylase
MCEGMPVLEVIDHPVDYGSLSLESRHRFSYKVSAMADGSHLVLPVMVLVGGAHRPRLACVAGIHGDEHEGITALLELWEELTAKYIHGTLVLVPAANPPAFRAGRRSNPLDGFVSVDMNRAFPGKVDGDTTQKLAYHLFYGILEGADMVLSMHGWSQDAVLLPYAEYPVDTQVGEASRKAAYAFGVKYVKGFKENEWPHGVVGEACANAGIAVIETEIGGLGCTMPEQRVLYKHGVHNLMRHLGMEPDEPEIVVNQQEIRGYHILTAPQGGVVRRRVELGDEVIAGDCIATITDLTGEALARVESEVDGLIGVMRLRASVSPGELVAIVWEL